MYTHDPQPIYIIHSLYDDNNQAIGERLKTRRGIRFTGVAGELREADCELTFYAISDVHVELKENMAWLQGLPKFARSAVLVAGDLGVSLTQAPIEALRWLERHKTHIKTYIKPTRGKTP